MKSTKIAVALLALVLITSCLVGGTFAKYTSSTTGTSTTARAANWAFELNDEALEDSFTFDLFAGAVEVGGGTENEVAASNGDVVIAPGTQGSFELTLVNNSEVDAEYTITLTVPTTQFPLTFTIGEDSYDAADLVDGVAIAEDVAIDMDGGEATITVGWVWEFGESVDDTALAGTAAPTATLAVTVDQVD